MLYQAERVPSKNLQGINVGESVDKGEPSYTVSGHMNWCGTVENSMEVPMVALPIELPYDPTIHSCAYI